MKKNLLTITMLVLCLMISITLVAVPASAQDFLCYGTQEVILIDEPDFEFTMSCEGDRVWVLGLFDFDIIDLGQVEIEYAICNYDLEEDEFCTAIGEFTEHFSNELLKRDVKHEMLDGDKLQVEFKFKP